MNLSPHFETLGFLGAGNMASAILRAIIGGKLFPPEKCAVMDVITGKAEEVSRELGVRVAGSPAELFGMCTSVVLATKPQDLRAALEQASGAVGPQHRVISIAAGVRSSRIEAILPAGTRVVRVMPNTPAMIGLGAAAVAGGAHATRDDIAATLALFEAVGIAAEVREDDLDAVTALSGSGPAYIFRFIELMQKAGEEMGLEPELARKLTLQTVVGAARLASKSDEPPSVLRERVTSKGGTTAAALEVFEQRGLENIVIDALKRAQERSRELAAGA